ncbi:ABC transporter permease [Chryseolinea sp. T2]|uniref:ABC transporter permease n=1 Tax=Chryseolinea sp. T2 TaxID=3129255 RepID=UPI00307728E5
MIRSYFLVAWRSIVRHRLFSFINVFGLSLSIALGLVIMRHVIGVLRFETFNPNRHDIYRLLSHIQSGEKGNWTLASTPLPLKESLEGQLGIERVVRLYPSVTEEASAAGKRITVSTAFTGPSFLSTMGLSLQSGVNEAALSEARSAIISGETAKKFFGDIDPVGQTLTFETLGSFIVSGVIKQPDYGTHIRFDVFLSEATIAMLENVHLLPQNLTSWNTFQSAYTYVLLGPNAHISQLNSVLESIGKKINSSSNNGTLSFETQPLTSVSPGSDEIGNDIGSPTTWGKLMAEIAVGLVIVVAACFNYTNLTLARSLSRTKEIGVRKINGASRKQVFTQQIAEALLVSYLALGFALIIESLLYDAAIFSSPEDPLDVTEIIFVVTFTTFVGVLGGLLPALILSSFKAIEMLRKLTTEKIMGSMSLRKGLIVFQFCISLIVLIFMMVFHSQFSFMESVDPGFRMDDVLSVATNRKDYVALKSEFVRINGVKAVAAASDNFGGHATGRVQVNVREKSPFTINYFFVDEGIVEVSNLKILSGRNFDVIEPVAEREIIVNEAAVNLFGIRDIQQAVGERVVLDDSIKVTISAVIKNFYSEGVGISYRPLVLRHRMNSNRVVNLVVDKQARANTETSVRQILKRISPEAVPDIFWLKERHQQRYGEMGSVSMLGVITFMAISITCLGLLGLVVYNVETRRKEISIRKVIGASVRHLLYILSKGFASLLIIAGGIAIPIAWIGSELFLMNFANRIQLGVLIPLLSFAGLFLLGLSIIMSQVLRTALENPVENLANE